MPAQNIRRFQESITQELKVTKNRVRDLIGAANWGSEGAYKEAILRKVIAQFLPSNLKMGTGFIMSNADHRQGTEGLISTQLDIIVYEDKSPVIFREGDFVILTESSVRAVVEVKASVSDYSATNDNALNRIIGKLNRLSQFQSFREIQGNRKKFVGVFSFDYEGNIDSERVDTALRESNGLINHISAGPDLFVRYWETTGDLDPPILDYEGRCYIRYDLRNLSFSYFISNLLHIVADDDPVERYWFSFPVAGTKEIYRHGNIIRLNPLT